MHPSWSLVRAQFSPTRAMRGIRSDGPGASDELLGRELALSAVCSGSSRNNLGWPKSRRWGVGEIAS